MLAYSAFQQTYRCFPVTMLHNGNDIDKTGKIVLPPTALDKIFQLNIQTYPLLFQLSNHVQQKKKVHCGVLEFTGEEGHVYAPQWMIDNLGISFGDFVKVRTVDLIDGKFVKFQPQSKDFLDISNPKAVLESVLRNYSALGVGESIRIHHSGKDYFLNVTQVKPFNVFNAIAILDIDLTIDFEPPLDYVEPSKPQPVSISEPSVSQTTRSEDNNKPPIAESPSTSPSKEEKKFAAFTGQGYSLSSPTNSPPKFANPSQSSSLSISPSKASPPKSKLVQSAGSDSEDDSDRESSKTRKFKAFSGKGYSLK